MMITRKELDYYRNHDSEIEMYMEKADYRRFGAADNTKAKEYYQKLIDEWAIPNNFWNVETPIGEEDSDE